MRVGVLSCVCAHVCDSSASVAAELQADLALVSCKSGNGPHQRAGRILGWKAGCARRRVPSCRCVLAVRAIVCMRQRMGDQCQRLGCVCGGGGGLTPQCGPLASGIERVYVPAWVRLTLLMDTARHSPPLTALAPPSGHPALCA